jgi:MoxR-like ATPase
MPEPFHGFTLPPSNLTESERQRYYEDILLPQFMALAEHLYPHGQNTLPRRWDLYTTSFRLARKAPHSAYYLVIDRPPRGGGIYISIDESTAQFVVALQIAPRLREALQRLLARDDGSIAQHLLACTEVRYRGVQHLPATTPWYEHYLAQRRAGPLLAGHSLPLTDERLTSADLAAWVTPHLVTLLDIHDRIIQHIIAAPPSIREVPVTYTTTPDVATIAARVSQSDLIIPPAFVTQLHLSLQQRPFVLLAGPPGVGKSALARRYADALYDLQPHQEHPAYVRIAVQPDWHHARDILGYYNALADAFHATPLTRLMYQALRNPQQPFVVCLDELNLARPEYYLAPIFSALESSDRLIDLGVPGHQVRLSDGDLLPNPLPLPANIAWIGTINDDDSTYPLTTRVLDRMLVLEMPPVDLEAWRKRHPHPIDDGQWQTITQVQAVLADVQRPLGYRALDDVWQLVARATSPDQADPLFDDQLRQRLSARLRGLHNPQIWARIAPIVSAYPLTAARIQRLRTEHI